MKIYTRTGDSGTTGLFGSDRVAKTHPRINAYGTVDETNSFIGLARSFLNAHPERERVHTILERIQGELFTLGADLASPSESKGAVPRISLEHVRLIEEDIDSLEEELPPLKQFILPGGNEPASALHVARTVCRRAERLVFEASATEAISQAVSIYLNRLSDLLFVLARWVNFRGGTAETKWTPKP
jgi:cob(I)alamin adenosyltransferase